jgi:agmatine deiminase
MPDARKSPVRALPEWQENAACLSAFPVHAYAWGEHLAAAQRDFLGFCLALGSDPRSEPLELLVADAEAERVAREALRRVSNVRYVRMPYGDVWLRDTSPIFVQGPRGLETVRFAFNGWGDKYRYPHDDDLAERLCARYALPSRSFPSILEGGAIELDGLGTCLTTESCLLNDNRALERGEGVPARRERLARELAEAFGVTQLIWLTGGLLGDHTDGHIDNIARFVAPGVVVHMRASGDDDPNRDALAQIEAELRAARDARGRPLELHALPSPGRVLGADGAVMAASYCNFYLGNAVVVMPSFDSPMDEPARRALARAFPRHRVLMSSARAFLEGGGTFHCMTRQIPKPASPP